MEEALLEWTTSIRSKDHLRAAMPVTACLSLLVAVAYTRERMIKSVRKRGKKTRMKEIIIVA